MPNVNTEARDTSAEKEQGKHRAYLQAINRITDEIAVQHQQNNIGEKSKSLREWVMIFIVLGALVASTTGDFIFWNTMREARKAASQAHIDADKALIAANNTSVLQHLDTSQALAKTDVANGISQDTAKQQLRAYLTGVPSQLLPRRLSAKAVEWYFLNVVKNGGVTPARQIVASVTCGIVDRSSGSREIRRIFPPIRWGDIGPGTQSFLGSCAEVSESLEKFRSNNKAIFLISSIRYRDIFNEFRNLRTCSELDLGNDPIGDGQTPQTLGTSCPWLPDCTDDECKARKMRNRP